MRWGRVETIHTLAPPSLAALIDLETRLSPPHKVHGSVGVAQQAAAGPQVKRRGWAGARDEPSAQVTQSTRLEKIRTLDPPSLVALANLTKRFFLRPLVWKTWACGRLRSSYTAARRRINQGGRAGDHSGDEGVRQGVKEGEATKVCGDRCTERNNTSALLSPGGAAADHRAPPASSDPRGSHSMRALRLKKHSSSTSLQPRAPVARLACLTHAAPSAAHSAAARHAVGVRTADGAACARRKPLGDGGEWGAPVRVLVDARGRPARPAQPRPASPGAGGSATTAQQACGSC